MNTPKNKTNAIPITKLLTCNRIGKLGDFIICKVERNIIVAKEKTISTIEKDIFKINLKMKLLNILMVLISFIPGLIYGYFYFSLPSTMPRDSFSAWHSYETFSSLGFICLLFFYVFYLMGLVLVYDSISKKIKKKYISNDCIDDIENTIKKLKKVYEYSSEISCNIRECKDIKSYRIYKYEILDSLELENIKLLDGFDGVIGSKIELIKEDIIAYEKIRQEQEKIKYKNQIAQKIKEKEEAISRERQRQEQEIKKKREERIKREQEEQRIYKKMEDARKILRSVQSAVTEKIKKTGTVNTLIENFIVKKLFFKIYSFPLIMNVCAFMLVDTCFKMEDFKFPNYDISPYISDFNLLLKLIDNECKNDIMNYIKENNIPWYYLEMGDYDEIIYGIYKKGICNVVIDISIRLLNDEFLKRFKNILDDNKEIDKVIETIINYPNVYFIENLDLLFGYLEMKNRGELSKDYKNLLKKANDIKQKQDEKKELEQFKLNLLSTNPIEYVTLSDIDNMTGIQFEIYLKNLFIKMGYDVQTTKATQDQGLDLIVKNAEQVIGVQAKCYNTSNIGNKAIQEVISGAQFYNCTHCLVVTNSYYTKQAVELADKTNVILWDRDKLSSLLTKYPLPKM